MRRLNLLLFGLLFVNSTFAQSVKEADTVSIDTMPSAPIEFTIPAASDYIQELLDMESLWSPEGDTLKLSLERLLDHFNEPFDSVEMRLKSVRYDDIGLEYKNIIKYDTLPVRWLNDSSFIIDSVDMERDPLVTQKIIRKKSLDFSTIAFIDELPDLEVLIDSLLQKQDTITRFYIDTLLLRSHGLQIFQYINRIITPPVVRPVGNKKAILSPGLSHIIISEPVKVLAAKGESPFYIVPNEKMPDSLQMAIETLLTFTANRDSILLYITDLHGHKTTYWITDGKEDLNRLWVKNYKNDSITIWMGNPARHEISFLLEEDVNVNRMSKISAADIPVISVEPDRTLAEVEPLKAIPVFWDYEFSSTFGMNQTYLSNWSKGGENSLATMLDIFGQTKYTNTRAKTQWTSNGRLKYGSIITEEYGLRTNTDMFELNSQYNRVIKQKIDFSAVFYMKNQIARGYKYPNDSVVVSKFLNPATLTVGLGFEYKPFKNTSFNLSPLSYKNTFVLDTANIDQTAHGIAADKRARQEMGAQLLFTNKLTIVDGFSVSNSMRLFSSYLNKPQNIDVDWEINLDKKINWYFSVRLNLHMIYDHDVRFPVLDENDEPVRLPDGTIKKVPRTQFKEFLGLALLFRF